MGNLTKRLSDAVNALGNYLTGARWPEEGREAQWLTA